MKNFSLTEGQVERLQTLGINNFSDEKKLRKELAKRLNEKGIPDMENDPIEEMIDILSAFEDVDSPSEKPLSKSNEKKPKVKNQEQVDDKKIESTKEEPETSKKQRGDSPIVVKSKGEEQYYDGRVEEHVEIVKKSLSKFFDKKYKLVFNQIGVKIIPIDSNVKNRIGIFKNIVILNNKVVKFQFFVTGFRLFGLKTEEDIQDKLDEILDVFEEKIHVGSKGKVSFKGLLITELEDVLKSAFFKEIEKVFNNFIQRMDKNYKKMREEFEPKPEEVKAEKETKVKDKKSKKSEEPEHKQEVVETKKTKKVEKQEKSEATKKSKTESKKADDKNKKSKK